MYWPNKQSINLNLAVAQLFIQTYQKFFIKLNNRTNQSVPIDILKSSIKRNLLFNTLIELEIIVLDIIELNLTIKDIKKLYYQILYDLIKKTTKKFLQCLNIKSQEYTININCTYSKLFFYENTYISHNLFIYLIFGSDSIQNNIFLFNNLKTPIYHVKSLFENFIIQISNIVIFNILENCALIDNSSKSIIDNHLYNKNYKSIRDISNFQNNFFIYSWINLYIYYPQNIYCSQYQLWLFSSKGIIYKHIYTNRYINYVQLSHSQMSSIIYLEIQDFIIPKINFFITMLGKLIIYIVLEIINKVIKILLNQIIIRLNNYKK